MNSVILAGGGGRRLWPVSTDNCPKPFLKIFKNSLFELTFMRLGKMGPITVVANKKHAQLVISQMKPHKKQEDCVLFEPDARNTAAAMCLATLNLLKRGGGEEIVGFFPADHYILKSKSFEKCLSAAIDEAQNGRMVTIGIKPTRPAIGFGYVKVKRKTSALRNARVLSVSKFIEKPNRAKAQKLLSSGDALWNSGIFIGKVSLFAELFQTYAPDIWLKIGKYVDQPMKKTSIYRQCRAISFDYAVAEKVANLMACVVGDFGWRDLGTWDDILEFTKKIAKQNLDQFKTTSLDSKNNFVVTLDKLNVGLIGIKNMIILQGPDGILISPRGRVRELTELAARMAKKSEA